MEEPLEIGDYLCARCVRAGEKIKAGPGISWCQRCSRRTGMVVSMVPPPTDDEQTPAIEVAVADPVPLPGLPGLPERGPARFGPKAR